MFEYIFFDWDNTLWDFSLNSKLSLIEVYEKFDLKFLCSSSDEFLNVYHKINDNLWADYRNGKISKDFLIKSRFNDTFNHFGYENIELSLKCNDYYLEATVDKTAMVDGAVEILNMLSKRGKKLYVVTNGFNEVQHRKIRNSGVSHLFDKIIISDMAGALKPSKEFFDYAFKTTGADKEKSLLIGDDPQADIAGAALYGLKSVYFNRFSIPCAYPHDFEINSLSRLSEIVC